MADPILDITSLVPDRQVIRILGHPYDLALHDDFSLEQRRDLNKTWQRILEIEEKTDFTPTDNTEYNDLVRKLAGMVLPDCPKPTIKQIGRGAQEAIVLAFFAESDPRMVVANKQLLERAKNPMTGETLSPDSNGSTEATPDVGPNSQ